MIDELEARIAYTKNQIQQKEKQLIKANEEIKFLEGSLVAYKDLLAHIQVQKSN